MPVDQAKALTIAKNAAQAEGLIGYRDVGIQFFPKENAWACYFMPPPRTDGGLDSTTTVIFIVDAALGEVRCLTPP